MTYAVNATHDPALRSWVESANAPGTEFPIQNLPFGSFQRTGSPEPPRSGIAIGDQIVDVGAAARDGLLQGRTWGAGLVCASADLNGLMSMGPEAWSPLRARLSHLLSVQASPEEREKAKKHLVPMSAVEMLLPARIGDYSDFYASIHHATNVGKMLRPDNPLLPNYKYVPIGYHGRSSSIVVSGTPVRRPKGQRKPDAAPEPLFGPSQSLDYELELGFFVGGGNFQGEPIPIGAAEDHLFGVCLLNDWSARDVQAWEYQPLGPFLAKSFATSISPWVVTIEALEPFRTPAFARPAGDPAPLPYLRSPRQDSHGGVDLTLQVLLATKTMREKKVAPVEVCRSNARDLYWTPAQLLAHHTSNGCNLRPGDLLGSGTVSGESKDARGCLLERTWRGTEPLALPGGETRRFLEDGDEVILRGFCEKPGLVRIGLGECRGVVEAAAPG
ncbi:MAG TPA: fumarylacetoacetase [Planctomycetota bacterium]|nr:fumarylacetoacetase [Planctomycetota bacterium]